MFLIQVLEALVQEVVMSVKELALVLEPELEPRLELKLELMLEVLTILLILKFQE
jgi:hypothetical protein